MTKDWKRIVLVVFVLIGGTMSFSYWSLNQFDNAFENLSASYIAISPLVSGLPTATTTPMTAAATSTAETSTTTPVTATSTPPIPSEQSSGTESGALDLPASSSDEGQIGTTASSDQNDPDSKFQLIFSPKKNGVYAGCTYEISWSAPTTITSLKTALIDAGTRKPAGPGTSKLAKEYNNIEADSQNLKWKVGTVWPGKYFISISNVNGADIDERSPSFIINSMPDGSNKKEQKNLCEETGGNLLRRAEREMYVYIRFLDEMAEQRV